MPTSSDPATASARPAGVRKSGPKKAAAKPSARARAPGSSPAERMLREIRTRGEALTDQVNRLLARLA